MAVNERGVNPCGRCGEVTERLRRGHGPVPCRRPVVYALKAVVYAAYFAAPSVRPRTSSARRTIAVLRAVSAATASFRCSIARRS